MRVVFRMSAIVAALAIGAAALGGCGQRGPLYMPIVPPLPAKPADLTEPPPSDAKPAAAASAASGAAAASDAEPAPLSLAPDSRLGTTPASDTGSAKPASSPASASPQDQ
jgi:predicted small lipoprotein YifL